MIVTIKPLVFEKLRDELIKLNVIEQHTDGYGRGEHRYNGKGRHKYDGSDGTVDLTSLTKKECQKLCDMVENCGIHGTRIVAADIKKFLRASNEGVESIKARTCRQAAWMFEHYFKELPHHTVFSVDEYGGNSHSGFYVGDVEYVPPKQNYGSREEPPKCVIDLWHVENDRRHKESLTLYNHDVCGMSCIEILAAEGYVPETPKLMDKLRSETERYYAELEKVGKQYVAAGFGLCDLDDATEEKRSSSYWGRSEKVKMDHFGLAKVVVDILYERDDGTDEEGNKLKSSKRQGSGPDPYRWHNWNLRFHSPSEDELVRHLEADTETDEPLDVDIPVHPLVPCFDLKRHTRLRVHVNNLTPYQYSKETAKRLVLPERDWSMVNLLVDHSSNEFADIVSGKGQSMNVLSTGIPGVGKTATAEVFAEFKERPLYSIQCSQLGMDAATVEENLTIIMRRANRWNAVLLLDEADVYIRKRGEDLNQNAIVGAFLRVLEYASCILFMTTNLSDSVDDAITSRCIARLHYEPPVPQDQAKIWRILADLNKLEISDKEIAKIAAAHPKLTGRDVKNLLKLSSFVSQSNGKPLSKETVEFALQFKPTETFEDK